MESGIKVARKWGTDVKCARRPRQPSSWRRTTFTAAYHDRQLLHRRARPPGFGHTPGFRLVPYGDADAVAAAIDRDTVAVLIEPIQGEAGIIVPPDDYLPRCARCALSATCC